VRRVIALLRAALAGYGRHADSQFAAALAYRALFALVPFVTLLAVVLDIVLPTSAREEVVEWLLGALPGEELQASVNRELATSGALTSVAGLIAFATLLWSATGMTGSLRTAFWVIWEAGPQDAFVRAKLRDVVAIGVLAALVLASFALSLLTQVAIQAGVHASDALGLSNAAGIIRAGVELLTSGATTFAALLVVYGLAAPRRPTLRALWPCALATAVAIDVGVAAYAFYLVHVASFNSVYGPLGAAFAFLALLYVAAVLVLFGAELIVSISSSTGDAAEAQDGLGIAERRPGDVR
jgi:membrane protein